MDPIISRTFIAVAHARLEHSQGRRAANSPPSEGRHEGRSRAARVATETLLLLIIVVLVGWLVFPRPASTVTTAAAGDATTTVVANVRAQRPNIVMIITDDQRTDTMSAMPEVRSALADQGVTFTHAFVSNSLCCPSRSAILTGSYSHTNGIYTNVYTAASKLGGWPLFHKSGDERHTIAVALNHAGYRTALFGKYLNEYRGTSAPPGWDRWGAFLGEGDGGSYYDYTMLDDGPHGPHPERHGSLPSDYSTTVIANKALSFLRETPETSPFFLYVAPYGPHEPITPAPRDLGTRNGYRHPLPASFDEPVKAGEPAYIRRSPGMTAATAEGYFQLTEETVASIDRMVGSIVHELRTSGRLHNTIFVFMSDNGIAYGDHRWVYKMTPYDETIGVPMIVRYDPVTSARAGTRSGALIGNIDIAPTIADLARIPFRGLGTVDGRSMRPLLSGKASHIHHALLLEHVDFPAHFHVPSYCGVRELGWMFTRYQTGEKELFNLRQDPFELHNVLRTRPLVAARLKRQTRSLCSPLPPGYTWP
jgi:arylsulfatase A-like enzyme